MSNTFNLTKGTNTLMNRVFRKAEGVVWDVMTGRIGLRTEDGIATLATEDDNTHYINTQAFDAFGMEVPAFAQATPVADVKIGDIIFFGNKSELPGWVVGRRERKTDNGVITSFSLMRTSGTTTSWQPPKVQFLGMGGNDVMVLRSLTSVLPGGEGSLGGMQSTLTQMINMQVMMGGDSLDFEKIMPMLLMGGLGGGAAGSGDNSNMMQNMMMMMQMMQGGEMDMQKMMMLQMMSGQGGNNNLMQTMMMMQMMQGGGGNLFGGSKAANNPFRKG